MENLAVRPAVANISVRMQFGLIVSAQCLYFLEMVRALHVLIQYSNYGGSYTPRHVCLLGDLFAC